MRSNRRQEFTVAETGRSGLSRSIEIAANFATLIVAVLLSVVLVRNYLIPTASSPVLQAWSAPARPTDVVTVGIDLSKRLSGVNWNRNGRTLVLSLSTRCHFCTESAPFFRQIKKGVGKNVKVVGVLPEPVAEAELYLNHEGVHVDEVRQIALDTVGVTETPTMLLVNKDGIVTQTWVGKLAPDKQEQALKVIGTVPHALHPMLHLNRRSARPAV